MLRQYPNLFQDPQIAYPADPNLQFADYIMQLKNIELIASANLPFELRPKQPARQGVLLIHGLLDSPYTMRDVGTHLQAQGLLVRSILLPGHGTVPGALLNVRYQDWLQAVNYGVASFKNEVEKIYLVGYSTGATLAFHHVSRDKNIAGIIALAPAIKIRSLFDFLSNIPRLLSWAWPRAAWFQLSEEIDYAKYTSVAFNAVYQVYLLAKQVNKINAEALSHCPLFMALSYEDEIVCGRASLNFFEKHKQAQNRMLLYSENPLQFTDSRIHVRSSAYPAMHIQNLSHIGLPFSPDNPHYGMHGDFSLASHINEDSHIVYGAEDKLSADINQILYSLKLTKQLKQRLTFNPDFNFMSEEISRFIVS